MKTMTGRQVATNARTGVSVSNLPPEFKPDHSEVNKPLPKTVTGVNALNSPNADFNRLNPPGVTAKDVMNRGPEEVPEYMNPTRPQPPNASSYASRLGQSIIPPIIPTTGFFSSLSEAQKAAKKPRGKAASSML